MSSIIWVCISYTPCNTPYTIIIDIGENLEEEYE